VQRGEFGRLVDDTIRGIESAQFLPHSGVRFPQNPVRAAHTWASVWDNSNWSIQPSFAVREKILVCLTSLRTSNPPMLPKLNKKRVLFVLTKIDERPWRGRSGRRPSAIPGS
jgi:hypothetical protein